MAHKAHSMRTPLGKVRGLGSAKSGLSHWWHQRLTAFAMLPLICWMIWLIFSLSGADYQQAVSLISHPVNATIMLLFVGVGFWHAALGLQVVLEDYVGNETVRMIALIMVKMLAILLASLSLFSILKIAL
jgi:succinate dehydrogenase / fumarate reductase membrane anchor subunit